MFDPQAVSLQLDKILASPGFIHAERLSRFLRFVVAETLAGRDGQIKETVIGSEVFRRKPDYDPKADPIVRIEAGKLRSRLTEYYHQNARDAQVLIELPKGGYVPVFSEVEVAPVPTPASSMAWWPAIAAAILIAGAVWFWNRTPAPAPLTSIAVLPFVNLSPDSANEYFSDGMTEEIIHALTPIEGLQVASRTSSFSLKGKKLTVREIGKLLGVGAVLEGSLRRDGTRLLITAQLIRVSDDTHLLSRKYERGIEDVFAVQEELARSIVNAMRIQLKAELNRPLVKRYTENLEAYELYWKGRSLYDKWDLEKSLALFQEAIAKDPNYAPAYSGVADAHIRLANRSESPGQTEYPMARAAAVHALSLDPFLAEAHASLGWLDMRERNWLTALSRYRQALEINPKYAWAHRQLGSTYLLPMGRTEEAIQELHRGLELDPFSADIRSSLAFALLSAGRIEEAMGEAQKTLQIDPNSQQALFLVGRVSLQKKSFQEGVKYFESLARQTGWSRIWLGYAYGVSGRKAEAQRVLEEIKRSPDRILPEWMVLFHTGMGDIEEAFQWAEKMYQEEGALQNLKLWPEYAPLRSDPRYVTIMRKISLPP